MNQLTLTDYQIELLDSIAVEYDLVKLNRIYELAMEVAGEHEPAPYLDMLDEESGKLIVRVRVYLSYSEASKLSSVLYEKLNNDDLNREPLSIAFAGSYDSA